jgi:hypothetical protein
MEQHQENQDNPQSGELVYEEDQSLAPPVYKARMLVPLNAHPFYLEWKNTVLQWDLQ